jgi:pimeloyl-ACP methyl ester carboxylesterase
MANDAGAPAEADLTTFSRRAIDVAGSTVQIAQAGQGAPLLLIGNHADPLPQMLAGAFALTVIAADDSFAALTPAMKARRLAGLAQALDLDTYSVCAEAAEASAALHLAAGAPEAVQRCVLIAPQVYDAGGILNDPSLSDEIEAITCHSLALFGTDGGGNVDAVPALYRERIPNCHLMFVYDSTDPVRGRPQAAYEVVADFLNRAEGFLVSEQDGRLHT